MNDSREKYLELIHAQMDGEATEKELAPLREYLASDPEAQKERAELAKLTNVLAQVEEVETPADLHASIMAALPPSRPAMRTVAPNGSPWRLRGAFLRYAYALAAGLILGAVLTGVAFRSLSPMEKSGLYGTLAPRQNDPLYVPAERMNLDSADLEGSVELRRSATNAMLVFDLQGQQPVQVEVGFDGSPTGTLSFNQEPTTIRFFQAKEGTISFQSDGKQRSTVILSSEKGAPLILDLRFYAGGKLIHQGKLGTQVPGASPK